MFRQKGSSSKLARARMPKFSQNIYKTIELEVTENQIDWVIQIDVVKKSLQGLIHMGELAPLIGSFGWGLTPGQTRIFGSDFMSRCSPLTV